MKYCTHCGGQLDDKAAICIHCGRTLEAAKPQNVVSENDSSNTGFAIIGFIIPIVGIILYAVYCSTSPKKAKSALNGAIVGFVVSVVASVIMSILSTVTDIIIWNGLFEIFEEIMYW